MQLRMVGTDYCSCNRRRPYNRLGEKCRWICSTGCMAGTEPALLFCLCLSVLVFLGLSFRPVLFLNRLFHPRR